MSADVEKRHPRDFPVGVLIKSYAEMNAEQRLAFDAGFMWADRDRIRAQLEEERQLAKSWKMLARVKDQRAETAEQRVKELEASIRLYVAASPFANLPDDQLTDEEAVLVELARALSGSSTPGDGHDPMLDREFKGPH